MDRFELNARRILAKHGAAVPTAQLHQLEWDDLLDLRNGLNGAMNAIVKACEAGSREMSGEESDASDLAMELVAGINRETSIRDRSGNRSPRASGRQADPTQLGARSSHAIARTHLRSRSPRYAELFNLGETSGLSAGGFRSAGEFYQLVAGGRADARLQNAYMSEGIGADGGFLVPSQFVQDLFDGSLEGEIIRPRARVLPMSGPAATVGIWDTLNNSSAIGGFSIAWSDENAEVTAQKGKFRSVEIRARKCRLDTEVTNELLADAVGLEADLGEALRAAIGFGLDESFLEGDGVGKPRGILNDAALIVQDKEGSQAADTIVGNNILKMYARLHPRCHQNAIWIANSTLLPQLLSVHIAVENAGTPVGGSVTGPLLKEAPAGAAGYKFTLMGLPLFTTEKSPVLGDQGDLILCDPSQYYVGMRKELTLERSNAPGWSRDVTSFRATLRVDGLGRWSSAITPRNGNTLSWCVTLQAR